MKSIKIAGILIAAELLAMQQAYAGTIDPGGGGVCDGGPPLCPDPGTAVPELDGSGAIIAIGLAAVLVAFVRERYFRK